MNKTRCPTRTRINENSKQKQNKKKRKKEKKRIRGKQDNWVRRRRQAKIRRCASFFYRSCSHLPIDKQNEKKNRENKTNDVTQDMSVFVFFIFIFIFPANGLIPLLISHPFSTHLLLHIAAGGGISHTFTGRRETK